jgi:hypothetical protein
VNPGRARGRDRATRARTERGVLADQRPVEVARNRLDLAGKVRRKLQPCGLLMKSTRSLRSEAGNDAYDFGMTFFG